MSEPIAIATRAQALALAALVECATLVDELARAGNAPLQSVRALTGSLLRFEWQHVEDVYGGAATLHRGLQRLEVVLALGSRDEQPQVLRYALALAHLGKRLARDPQRLATIRARLGQLAGSTGEFTGEFADLAPALAAIYEDTISHYSYRIKVVGNGDHLRDPDVIARIRALLLTGVRAAVLWRFVGGSLPGLLLRRGQLISACRALRTDS